MFVLEHEKKERMMLKLHCRITLLYMRQDDVQVSLWSYSLYI